MHFDCLGCIHSDPEQEPRKINPEISPPKNARVDAVVGHLAVRGLLREVHLDFDNDSGNLSSGKSCSRWGLFCEGLSVADAGSKRGCRRG